MGRIAAALLVAGVTVGLGAGAAYAAYEPCKPPGFVKPSPGASRSSRLLRSEEERLARTAVDACPAPTTCVVEPTMCVTERSCYGYCRTPEDVAAAAASQPERPDPPNAVSLPFLTVLGQGGMIQRGRAFLGGAGVQAAVHLDVSRYVVPYAEGTASFLDGNAYSGTAGVFVGWRTFVRASMVGMETKEGRVGDWVTRTTTTTYTWWDDERYPLLVGAQIGGGVFGMSSALTDQGLVPEVLSPRIEVGPSLLGQHHVSALFTVDPTSGVVGLRGNAWLRLPFDWFWLSMGMSWDVAFNPPATGGYDFIVTGALGAGFSKGEKAP